MRHIITLFARSLVLSALVVASQCVCAQKWNAWVAVQALDSTINAHQEQPRMLRELAEDICKKGSHQPNVVTGVARAFLHYNYDERLTEIGMDYLNEVLAKHPDYAPAYVLMGNLYMSDQVNYKKTAGMAEGLGYHLANDTAFYWYQRAIDANPKDVCGYENYAALLAYEDPDKVYDMLLKCKDATTGYPAELKTAGLLSSVGRSEKSLQYFAMVDTTSLTENELVTYVKILYGNKKWEDLKKVSEYGMNEYPENREFVSDLFYAEYNLKNFSSAITVWEKLLTSPDSLTVNDYVTIADAYTNDGKPGKAEKIYKDIISTDSIVFEWKNMALDLLIDIYKKRNDYDLIEQTYENYISSIGPSDKQAAEKLKFSYGKTIHDIAYELYYEDGIDNSSEVLELAPKSDKLLTNLINNNDINDLNKWNLLSGIYRMRMNLNMWLSDIFFKKEYRSQFQSTNGFNPSKEVLNIYNDENNPYEKELFAAYEKVACKYLGFMYYVQNQNDLTIKHLQRYIELEKDENNYYYKEAKKILSELQKPARRRRR